MAEPKPYTRADLPESWYEPDPPGYYPTWGRLRDTIDILDAERAAHQRTRENAASEAREKERYRSERDGWRSKTEQLLAGAGALVARAEKAEAERNEFLEQLEDSRQMRELEKARADALARALAPLGAMRCDPHNETHEGCRACDARAALRDWRGGGK